MDEKPTPDQSVRLFLEVIRARDGRLEGRLRPERAEVWRQFSGVLELLKALEEHTCTKPRAQITYAEKELS
jgi:hypothetical protein